MSVCTGAVAFPNKIFPGIADESVFPCRKFPANKRCGSSGVSRSKRDACFCILHIAFHAVPVDVGNSICLAAFRHLNVGGCRLISRDSRRETGETGIDVARAVSGLVLGIFESSAAASFCHGVAHASHGQSRFGKSVDGHFHAVRIVVDGICSARCVVDGEGRVDDGVAARLFFKQEADAVVLLQGHCGVGRIAEAHLLAQSPARGESFGRLRGRIYHLIPDGNVLAPRAFRN